MKWLHSVVHEPDFVDPWTAISQAFHLAFELGFMNGADANFEPAGQGVHTSLAFQQPCPVPRRSVKSVMSVQFCPDVDLYIGSEDCLRFFQLSIPEETLSMSGKPWSVGRRLANPCPVSLAELPPVLSRSHCEAIDFADSAVQGKLSFTGFDANDEQPSDQTPGCYSFPSIHVGDWQNHNSVHVDAHPRTCFDGPDHIVDTPPCLLFDKFKLSQPSGIAFDLTALSPSVSNASSAGTTVANQALQATQWLDMMLHFDLKTQRLKPLCSKPFASKNHSQVEPDSLVCPASVDSVAVPRFLRCRREHESPIPWNHQQPPSDDEDEEGDEGFPHEDPPTNPAFLQTLIARFSRFGLDVHSGDFEIPLRTWYLDHVNMRRWTAPRILQLVGPPHGWEQQFSSLWIDQIDPDDWFDLTIVNPDPPRTGRHSFVMMDIIVTQSLHMDRFTGLVTVMPQQTGTFDMFAVAYSFADFISGFDVILAADATRLCRYHPCTVTFGWDEIPNTLQPQHVMRHGDGFQLSVRHSSVPLVERASGSHDVPQASNAAASNASPAEPASLLPSTPEHPSPNDPVHRRFTTALHLFQFQAHEIIVELVNAQLAQPSHEIATAAGVPFQCLEAVHLMLVRPLDFPELAIPAILQRVGDLPLHSTERLILVDVVYFHHPDIAQAPNRPTIVRTVHRVDHHILRPQLLLVAAVFHYCEFLQDACEVTLDDRAWPKTAVEPRPVRHGSYAKIVVPPPQGYEVDTMVAADALHTDSQTDAIMDLLGEDFGDEDVAFLTQVTAERRFTCSVNSHMRALFEVCHTDPGHAMHIPYQCSQQQVQDSCTHMKPSAPVQVAPLGRSSAEVGVSEVFQNAMQCPALMPGDASNMPDDAVTPSDTIDVPPFGYTQSTLFKFFSRSPVQNEPSACRPHDRKCNEEQQQEPPAIMQDIPNPMPHAPDHRPRPIWHLELQSIFDELATVRFRETGRTMFVSVWYIHHGRYATCHAPRQVELDDITELWYADLCNAWWDQVQRTLPMRVLIVKPNPDNQLAPRTQRHIILEQGFQPDRAAIVFTAIFLANFRNGIFQKAEPVDIRISAQYIIDKYDFNVFCDFRPCTMTSGIMRFHQHVLEEIFSGISVQLVVGPPRSSSSASAGSSTVPQGYTDQLHNDHTALMQRARRWQRHRPGVTEPAAPSAPAAPSTVTVQQPITALPQVTLADMRDFRVTLQWMVQQATDTCLDPADAPFRIQTWFLDSNRRSRSEEPRTIVLRPLPHTWVPDIFARWLDEIDPQVPLHMHVVQPMPTAGTSEIHAHVLLVQNPNDLWRAALISIVYFDQDPWNPAYVATMLDVETTIEQIAFRTHVVHPSNPRAQQFQVEVRHASVTLDSRSPFHVRNGYHFELVVFDNSDPWADSVAFIQLSFASIKAKMRELHRQVTCAQRQCMIAPERQDIPNIAAISITQDPRNPAVTSPWDSLPFHGYLQALWQPLALLSPDATRPAVRVTTWYLDHIRYPQSFESRDASLTGDPHGWLRQMRRLWYDVILPHDPVHYHIVQPHPPNMQTDVAAHIILVQQPVEGFRSVLITLFDSAFIGAQIDRFATMAPSHRFLHTCRSCIP